jgi:serine/threonine protein kinase
VDFGFAKLISQKTMTNCGTLVYVAPEVLKLTGTSFEADVWSLGVVIHEMICGQTPFHCEDPMEQYDAIAKCRPKYSSQLGAQLRELLERIFVPDPPFRITLH